MFILSSSTRTDCGHIGAGADIRYRNAEIGKDYGLANLICWKSRFGEIETSEIKVFVVMYDDGAVFGPFVGWAKKGEKGITLFHPSTSGRQFSMTFEQR